ncbi:hypothetical protein H9P43_008920 [Blastocladiella emersonii ATCC 22665]|nr:hypothetical protein H9P43_008920 [Blastocladiella emersonii ATCC 22665]
MNWDQIEERDRRRDADARRLKDEQRRQAEEVKARRRVDFQGATTPAPTATAAAAADSIRAATINATISPRATLLPSAAYTALALSPKPLTLPPLSLATALPPTQSASLDARDTDLILARLTSLEHALDRERARRMALEEHVLADRLRLDDLAASLAAGHRALQADVGTLAAAVSQLRTAWDAHGAGGAQVREAVADLAARVAGIAEDVATVQAAAARVPEYVQARAVRAEAGFRDAIAHAAAAAAVEADRVARDAEARAVAAASAAVSGLDERTAAALAALRGHIDATRGPLREAVTAQAGAIADAIARADAETSRIHGVLKAEIRARVAADAALAGEVRAAHASVGELTRRVDSELAARDAHEEHTEVSLRAAAEANVKAVVARVAGLEARVRAQEMFNEIRRQQTTAQHPVAVQAAADDEDPVMAELERTLAPRRRAGMDSVTAMMAGGAKPAQPAPNPPASEDVKDPEIAKALVDELIDRALQQSAGKTRGGGGGGVQVPAAVAAIEKGQAGGAGV